MKKKEFDKIPTTTLVGSSWRSFNTLTKDLEIDKQYKGKYYLTKFVCMLLSITHPIENYLYKKKLSKVKLEKDHLFILGHWRSGTTFVHNDFSCDKQFGYTTTYQTVFPHAILFGQKMFKFFVAKFMPEKRPTDNLELKPDLPQEEEFALSNMMPYSYYNFWIFPKKMMHYCDKYLLMNNLNKEEIDTFEETFMRLTKLSLYNTGGSQYLSKNPPHTGRIKELLKMFPNAKFIYLMRNPYTVYESTKSFFGNTIKPLELQYISEEDLDKNIVDVYSKLYDKYEETKHLIPDGNLVEIKFEDYEKDPIEATRNIYKKLNLQGFDKALPAIEKYICKKKGHKKNNYEYSPSTSQVVEKNWSKAIKNWGYEL